LVPRAAAAIISDLHGSNGVHLFLPLIRQYSISRLKQVNRVHIEFAQHAVMLVERYGYHETVGCNDFDSSYIALCSHEHWILWRKTVEVNRSAISAAVALSNRLRVTQIRICPSRILL
jgi:hypothetical protein